jgi:SAM-dependent methyltransferase
MEGEFKNAENERSREKEVVFSNVNSALEQVVDEYGKEAARELLEAMQKKVETGSVKTLKEKTFEIENRPTLKEFQESALEEFKRQEIIHETENGKIVVNKEELLNKRREVLSDYGYRIEGREFYADDKFRSLANTFSGLEVVLETEDGARSESMEMFYLPKNKSQAFDREWVRGQNFHLGLWETGQVPANFDGRQPRVADDLNYLEASVAAVIWHPDYGDGKRDENGSLLVREKGSGDYVPVSGEWFKRQGLSYPKEDGPGSIFASPRESLRKHAPKLFEEDILKEKDFESKHKEHRGELQKITSGGEYSRNSVKHYLGKGRFAGKKKRIDRISDEFGVVVDAGKDGQYKIEALFNFFEPGDSGLKEYSGDSYRARAGADLTNVKTDEAIRERHPNEGVEEYKKRLKAVENYKLALRFDKLMQEETGGRLYDLPEVVRERVYRKPDILRDDLIGSIAFVDRLGQAGLESLGYLSDQPETMSHLYMASESLGLPESVELIEGINKAAKDRFQLDGLLTELSNRGVVSTESQSKLSQLYARHIEDTSVRAADLASRNVSTYEKLNEQMSIEGGVRPFDLRLVMRIDTVAELVKEVGSEGLRDELNEIAKEGGEKADMANGLLEVLNPAAPSEAHNDLKELYEDIEFERYEVNEKMQSKDMSVLDDVIRTNDKVMDLGAGTGRLLKPLLKKGVDVDGVDYVDRHVEIMRNEMPDAEIHKADWVDTKLEDSTYDVVYSLGRSILHEYQPDRQNALFAEANRVLSKGGRFVFDIPNKEQGLYRDLVDKYNKVMNDRQLPHRSGTIYDSPDGENFFTRYAYSIDDIKRLAAENGFQVEDIQIEDLETGEGDENLYITLRKQKQSGEVHDGLRHAAAE